MRSALVLGASGLVGSHLVKALENSAEYSTITLIVRKEINFKTIKIRQIVTKFELLYAQEKEFAVDDVFCCLGTTMKHAGSKEAFKKVDYEFCYNAGRLAKENSARHFLVVSAINASVHSPFFYSRVKGQLENDLVALGLNNLSIFRPSLLIGQRRSFRYAEAAGGLALTIASPLFIGPLKSSKPVPAQDVANAMVQHALNVASNNAADIPFKDHRWILGYNEFRYYAEK